jgi:hypothetical protein
MEKQESFVILDQSNPGLHNFWCIGDGGGVPSPPPNGHGRTSSGSDRGFSSTDYECGTNEVNDVQTFWSGDTVRKYSGRK